MKFVRYETPRGEQGVGAQVGDDVFATGYTDMVEFIAAGGDAVQQAARATESTTPVDVQRLLAPLPNPGKMLFMGRIFRQFRDNLADDVPPFVYARVASSIVGPDDTIRMPGADSTVLYEGELLAVIGRAGRGIAARDAMSHVFGYTQVNDLTWTDWIHGGADSLPQITMCKNADTFCPMGPFIVTADQYDPHDATCRVSINGEVRSVTTTADMVWKLPAVIEWLSRDTTLWPGDVIATGTSEALPIAVGDDVVVEFDGLGRLSNRVVAGWSESQPD